MSRRHRQTHRPDANHFDILNAYLEMGCTVLDVHKSTGALDLVVGNWGINDIVEIKDGSKVPSARKLSDTEQQVFTGWKGRSPVLIESIQDAVTHVYRMKREAFP